MKYIKSLNLILIKNFRPFRISFLSSKKIFNIHRKKFKEVNNFENQKVQILNKNLETFSFK